MDATISQIGYSTNVLMTFLLGDVDKKTKMHIVKDAEHSRVLSAFLGYLDQLLEANDYDMDVVQRIVDTHMNEMEMEMATFEGEYCDNDNWQEWANNINLRDIETPELMAIVEASLAECNAELAQNDPLCISIIRDSIIEIIRKYDDRPLESKQLLNEIITTCENHLQNKSLKIAESKESHHWIRFPSFFNSIALIFKRINHTASHQVIP